MGDWITLEVKGQTSRVYQSLPSAGSGPGIILCHAWWGLNSCFQALADRLARDGFVVLAPDLYHGYVANTIEEAEIGSKRLDYDVATAQVLAAAVFLTTSAQATGDRLGSIGYSLGSRYSMGLADNQKIFLAAAVNYYGNRGGRFKNSRAAFLHHFAATDAYISDKAAHKL